MSRIRRMISALQMMYKSRIVLRIFELSFTFADGYHYPGQMSCARMENVIDLWSIF